MTSRLTVLNMMLSTDFDRSVEMHRELGLEWMDLWGDIYGVDSVDSLDKATAERAATAIRDARLQVYCLSTRIFNAHVEVGEQGFRSAHLAQLERSLEIAAIVQPKAVRLIAGRLTKACPDANAIDILKADHPWVADVYREAIDAIAAAGFEATIENETTDCFLATPAEFRDFFEWLDAGDRVSLTWDVQNNWQMGTFPSLDVYRALKPLIGYVHLKGGQGSGTEELVWSTGLADASWPVVEIVQEVVDDGVSPVICLNPSHGAPKPGYDYGPQTSDRDFSAMTMQDIAFLRREVKGIEP